MSKVNTGSMRSYARTIQPSMLTDAIIESADYIDELEGKVKLLESSLKIYKKESDMYECSTHIDDFMYEFNLNEKGEILCLIKANGIEHTFGITEKDARGFLHLFHMYKSK